MIRHSAALSGALLLALAPAAASAVDQSVVMTARIPGCLI
jgi:hypothetical protein